MKSKLQSRPRLCRGLAATTKPVARSETGHNAISGLTLLGLGCAVLFASHVACPAQDKHDSPAWLVGTELARQRRQPIRVSWSATGLREGLAGLAQAERVGILLDRRLDPERPIELTTARVSLDELLEQIAERAAAGVAWLGPLAYIGPPQAASRLRTLAALRAADVRRLPKGQRAPLERESSWRWKTLSEPRQLAADLAVQANVEIESLELIAHDLWPAADLPPLSWTDRLSLLANEFDLTFEVLDASHLRLAPIEAPIAIERRYPGGKRAAEVAARFKQLAPEAEIEVRRGQVVVRGRLEEHELLSDKKPRPRAALGGGGVEVHTATVRDQPLASVLVELQSKLAIDIRVDEAALEKAGLSLERRVSFKVERATIEQLLRAALEAADLTFRREGNVYKVVPAP